MIKHVTNVCYKVHRPIIDFTVQEDVSMTVATCTTKRNVSVIKAGMVCIS